MSNECVSNTFKNVKLGYNGKNSCNDKISCALVTPLMITKLYIIPATFFPHVFQLHTFNIVIKSQLLQLVSVLFIDVLWSLH